MQVFLVRLLRGKNHPEARLHLVFRELVLQALQIEWILNEIIVNFDQKFMTFQLAEPLDPTVLLVLECWIITYTIDVIIVLIRLTVVVLLHLHLLCLSGGCLGIHGCSLLVKRLRVHLFKFAQ